MRELLEQSEAVEAAAWADLALSAPDEARRAAGLAIEAIGDARVLSATGLDTVLFNRAIGLRGDDLDGIRRAVRHYQARGIARYMLHLDGAARRPAVEDALRSYGLERYHRAWDRFVRDASAPPPRRPTDLVVREATTRDRAAAGALVAAAFDAGPRAAPLFAAAIGHGRWHVFVAVPPDRADAAPVSVGALYVSGLIGYLAFAATDPAWRGHGAQGATMIARIRRASEHGCWYATTETGEPVDGEPSPSRDNMLRCGFEVAARRENYSPIGFTWATAPAA